MNTTETISSIDSETEENNCIGLNKKRIDKKYLATVSFALLNNDYEVAPYLMVSHINDVKTSYLDSVYNHLTVKIKDSKYGNDLESLIQFRNKNKIN